MPAIKDEVISNQNQINNSFLRVLTYNTTGLHEVISIKANHRAQITISGDNNQSDISYNIIKFNSSQEALSAYDPDLLNGISMDSTSNLAGTKEFIEAGDLSAFRINILSLGSATKIFVQIKYLSAV